MTVNELISELQVLAAQGHGELDVTTYNHEDDDYDFATELQVLEGVKRSSYYDINPLIPDSKQKAFTAIS